MGIKRHPALQPFSRDHLVGLFHAQRLIKLSSEESLRPTVESFSDAYHREVAVHFADEDRIIDPLSISKESRQRLHNEHVELTGLIENLLQAPSLQLAHDVGNMLDAHIRWEEHELFPEIESALNREELEIVAQQTTEIEKSRHRRLL
jgi:hypothetical protein